MLTVIATVAAVAVVYLAAGLFVAAVCGLRRKSEWDPRTDGPWWPIVSTSAPTRAELNAAEPLVKVYDSREGGWL